MKKKRYEISILRCQTCGYVFKIPRPVSHKRARGHVKTMYCPSCQAIRNFTEYREFIRDGTGKEVVNYEKQ